jgi:hypothetical protein
MSGDNFSHRAGYQENKLEWLLRWLEKNPHATLGSGEGKILADEIARLRAFEREIIGQIGGDF